MALGRSLTTKKKCSVCWCALRLVLMVKVRALEILQLNNDGRRYATT